MVQQRTSQRPSLQSRSSKSKRNPFDIRSNNSRAKYVVLGKKVKGAGRNVAQARSLAEVKRSKTLAKSFSKRHKANVFQDKRLGEANDDLSIEEKMMLRFQRERKKKMRHLSAYNLADEDEEDVNEDDLFALTHDGKPIAEDDYEVLNRSLSTKDHEDDEEDYQLNKEIVQNLHFGGGGRSKNQQGEDTNNIKKSHKEIMQEVMMKSKLFKAERQKNKSTQEDVTEQLDESFNDVRKLLEFRPTRANGSDRQTENMDEFDQLAREFAFEAKAKATERRLSPEESAKKEADRLSALEKKRLARMKGIEEESSDDEDENGRNKKRRKVGSKEKKPQQIIMLPPTDDDLTNDYEMDPRFAEDPEDPVSENDDSESNEGEEDEDEEDDEDEEEEEDDDESDENEEGEDEDENVDEDNEKVNEETLQKEREAASQELPYVFPCPETCEDVTKLFYIHALDRSDALERKSLILKRIMTYYHPKIHVSNQDKMKKFFAILLRLFLQFGDEYTTHKNDLDVLTTQLFALAQIIPETAAVISREFVSNLFKKVSKTRGKKLKLNELLALKCLTRIYPSSDLRHNIMSPVETLLTYCLGKTKSFNTIQDIIVGLFSCTLLLDMIREKKKYLPEIMVFVDRLLTFFVPSRSNLGPHWLQNGLSSYLKDKKTVSSLPALSIETAQSNQTPDTNMEFNASVSASVLGATIKLIEIASRQFEQLPAFDHIFNPVYILLHDIAGLNQVSITPLQTRIVTLQEQFESLWSTRQPLRLQSFAPTILQTFTPSFDANYTVRKDKTLEKEKAKTKQLQRQVKRARKGAARELKRDAEYLARAQQQEETARISAKKEKQREIWKWLEDQNATFNEQVKKGGNMLKGGGSGPAKNRRVKHT